VIVARRVSPLIIFKNCFQTTIILRPRVFQNNFLQKCERVVEFAIVTQKKSSLRHCRDLWVRVRYGQHAHTHIPAAD